MSEPLDKARARLGLAGPTLYDRVPVEIRSTLPGAAA